MNDDLFALEVPDFMPNYVDKVKYGYSKRTKMRKNLQTLLYQTSEGFCMYCYSLIVIDKKAFGHLEHSIEKAIDDEKILEKCVLNIAIACPVCNDRFKKKGEQERIEYIKTLAEYKALVNVDCKAPKCYEMCDEYVNLRNKLYEKKCGHLLLQPLSKKNSYNKHPSTKSAMNMQYDLLKGEFIPHLRNENNLLEKEFIEDHINLFHLNNVEFRTDEIYRLCKDIINNPDSNINENQYNNLMVKVFVRKISMCSKSEIHNICKLIYIRGLLLGRNI
jgi:hypothetical protein